MHVDDQVIRTEPLHFANHEYRATNRGSVKQESKVESGVEPKPLQTGSKVSTRIDHI